jgi:trehalose 6-phosphate phosphatase
MSALIKQKSAVVHMKLPESLTLKRHAIFLDFDGTLVDLAARPDLVEMTGETRETVAALNEKSDGAVAIVTGRDIAIVDAFLAPLKLPVAGVHGLTRRDVTGRFHEPQFDAAPLATLKAELAPLIAREDGLLLEEKQGALVLHFRQRPELEAICVAAMEKATRLHPSITTRIGKMVIEAVGHPTNKGGAIESFMGEAPFRGRIPFFAGDDVTDEDGFAAVNRLGGFSVKVGSGETRATYRVEDRDALLAWFNHILKNSG